MFGRVELGRLREKVGEFAAGFDPALVSPAQANAMVDDAATIEKMAATVKALLAARVAETEVATREGDKTPAHALARKTGTTVGKAAETIRTGKRLAKQPKLDAAAREGRVSPEQAAAISDATEADPAAEGRLVDQAGHSTLSELKNECDRTRAAADRDAEERHKRILAARFARRRNCGDGSAEILFHSTVEQVAEVWSVISGYATQAFNLAGVKAATSRPRLMPPMVCWPWHERLGEPPQHGPAALHRTVAETVAAPAILAGTTTLGRRTLETLAAVAVSMEVTRPLLPAAGTIHAIRPPGVPPPPWPRDPAPVNRWCLGDRRRPPASWCESTGMPSCAAL
ncbi:MAG TPA: DUF222 domain-containing protein [Acidimicrobiales bacterium]|nr:DUF222 domain-containing protein [Acidimicrobiales bacterium]